MLLESVNGAQLEIFFETQKQMADIFIQVGNSFFIYNIPIVTIEWRIQASLTAFLMPT